MNENDWIVKNICVRNALACDPKDSVTADPPTPYHSPCVARTLLGGPGNRSRILSCSCGARFDGVYEYIGHEQRMCDWYAQHADIEGGGQAVAAILRDYDEARDVRAYPKRLRGRVAQDPAELLARLRRDPS